MPPNPAALSSPLAPAEVTGFRFHNRSIPSYSRNSACDPTEPHSREQVPGLLEIKDKHRP